MIVVVVIIVIIKLCDGSGWKFYNWTKGQVLQLTVVKMNMNLSFKNIEARHQLFLIKDLCVISVHILLKTVLAS